MTGTRRHGAPKKQIFPLLLPQAPRTSRTINRCQNPRPKFCAARPKSVQPTGWAGLHETKSRPTAAGAEVTTSARRCARSPNLAADRQTGHQPLAKPGRPQSRHPDHHLCSPRCAFAPAISEFPCLVVGIPPFPPIRVGDLARRLIPRTAALLAGGI